MRNLTLDEERLLHTLARNGAGMGFDDINHTMSMNDRVLGRLLQRLRRNGLIVSKRRDGDTRTLWYLTDDGKAAIGKVRR